MMLKKILYALFFFFVFFLASLALVVLLSPHVIIVPSAGISECESFTNGTFDPSKCKVVPGSLLVIVLKSSPMFSYVSNNLMIYALKTLTIYFLIIFVSFIVAAFIYYCKRKTILSLTFLASAVAIALITIPFLAPYTKEDIICYKTKSTIGEVLICHSLEKVEEGYVILRPSRYKFIKERVHEENVVGKVAIIINPPFGTLAYFTGFLYDVASSLWNIFKQGHIPIGYKIYYLVEK